MKKNGWGHLKTFSRTSWLSLIRLDINHPWGMGFKFIEMKGIALLQGEMILKE
jgi:hypothetical protein